MPTQTKENYLKAMFSLEAKNEAIQLSSLSKMLQVSAPTVNSMVKRMQEDAYVIYKKYQPIEMTELGRLKAASIVRKHRLSEMYLQQIMGFGWEEVHDIAEEMEHVKSDLFFDRMDEVLGFPSHDPHGSPIPDKSGNIQDSYLKTLSDCQLGDKKVLRALRNSSTEFLHYLNTKGIKLGTLMEVLEVQDFDASKEIRYRTEAGELKTSNLSYEVLSRLLVE
ncbi:MAG: metal-dependent transcriptional regulator [Flavobacteriaceae bacterium]